MALRLTLPRHPFALLLAVASLAAVGVVWAEVVGTLRDAHPVPSTGRANAIIWDGLVFESPAKLTRWLRSRGATYVSWSRTHPAARAVLEKLPLPATPATRSRPGVTTTVGASRRDVARAAPAGSLNLGRLIVLVVPLLVGGLCVFVALLPAALRDRWLPSVTLRAAQHRQILLGAGAAILVGLLVGISQI